MKNKISLLAIILIIITMICSCGKVNKNSHTFAGTYFDTFISVTIYDSCDETIDEELDKLCTYYDSMLSTENSQSTLYSVNNSNNQYVLCNDEFIRMVTSSIELASSTDGILDPTIETVSSLYDFNQSENNLPDEGLIKSALNNVSYNNITISGNYIQIPENTKINLGYMAKGYIADRIKEYLLSKNINNALINLGGNIVTIGIKNNKPFNIAIEKPFSDNEPIYAIHSDNNSIVTSGIYERYFTNNGTIYHHILDTKTGYPVVNNLYSVTVTGENSEKCDEYSTLLFILGQEEGLRYINSVPGYEALFITNEYKIVKSDNFPENVL